MFSQSCVIGDAVVDDEVGLLAVQFGLLHLHSCADLFFCGCVAEHRPLEADFFWRIDEEDFIDIFIEAALEENGTLQADDLCFLLFCPSFEVFQDSWMDDGIDLACMFGVGKEIVGETLTNQFLSVEDFRTYKTDEFFAYFLVCGCEPFGFLVTVIDGNAELPPQDVRYIALSATNAACDAYCLQLSIIYFPSYLFDEVIHFLRRYSDVRNSFWYSLQVQEELGTFCVIQ